MFLTMEILEQYKACDNGKKWFARYFPEGGELIDVINHKYANAEFLHWGYEHLTTSEEEKAAYYKKLGIDCENLQSVYRSDNVKNCSWVSRSSRVKDSDYVFSSKGVENSHIVSSSEEVDGSRQIFSSEFITNSEQIYHSKNVTESHNIINSDYVVSSTSVLNSMVVTNSHCISGFAGGTSKQVKDSYFLESCANVHHCMFCTGISNTEYQLFNQPIDPAQFALIEQQLRKYAGGWLMNLVDGEWPRETIPLDAPRIQRNVIKQYSGLPETFWRWVKTLPGYDPMVLYRITYQPRLLEE